jgi:hypothetical protein
MKSQAGNAMPDVSGRDVLAQLNAILESSAFRSSKRCQEFLRYVVTATVEGKAESLKERNIAVEVFGKGIQFEPGEDSLVRVKAREVRRRLAEYYESAPNSTFNISIPLGGYAPEIRPVKILKTAVTDSAELAQQVQPVQQDAKPIGRRRFLWLAGGVLGAAGIAAGFIDSYHRRSPLDSFWQPIFDTKIPLLIFIPILEVANGDGALSDRVGLGTTVAATRCAKFLTERHYPFNLRLGSDLTYLQLREQPSLLLGGFSSGWTEQMTRGLRFTLVRNYGGLPGAYVVDTQTKQAWGPIRAVNGYANEDYAILCRLFDAATGQIVLIAAGLTTFGTESASAYFTDFSLFAKLVEQAPKSWQGKNFQAVIQISIMETTPSAPRIVASYFW